MELFKDFELVKLILVVLTFLVLTAIIFFHKYLLKKCTIFFRSLWSVDISLLGTFPGSTSIILDENSNRIPTKYLYDKSFNNIEKSECFVDKDNNGNWKIRTDSNGEFHFKLHRKYVGKIIYVPIYAKYVKTNITGAFKVRVQPYGYVHAVPLIRDFDEYGNRENIPDNIKGFNYEETYWKALIDSQVRVRKHVDKISFYFFALLIAVLGLLHYVVQFPIWLNIISLIVLKIIWVKFYSKMAGYNSDPIY